MKQSRSDYNFVFKNTNYREKNINSFSNHNRNKSHRHQKDLEITQINGKKYSHLDTLNIKTVCKHLPVYDKRSHMGVTVVDEFVLYHDRDLYPQPSDPKIEELINVLKKLNSDHELQDDEKIEYVLHLIEANLENHKEITTSSVKWYGRNYLKYDAADSYNADLALKRSQKSDKAAPDDAAPDWKIDGWIKSQNKSERMRRSLTSPEIALSSTSEISTASLREKVENLNLEIAEDSEAQESTAENSEVSHPVEVFENKEKNVPVIEETNEASETKRTPVTEREMTPAKTTESVSPSKKPERPQRKSLLIKNLLSQAGIFKNVEKESTFEERLKEREKVIQMNEKLAEKKQPVVFQSTKSKSKKTEILRRSNSSDSLSKTLPLDDQTTNGGSMKPRFPKLEKFLDKKNNEGGSQKSFVTGALDLSVSMPQYRKFQQGDIDCCTYDDVYTKSFYVKDDLRKFFEKKALKWKSYHKNLVDSHCHFDMLFNKIRYRKSVTDYFKEFGSIYLNNFEACVNIICDPSKYSSQHMLADFLKKVDHPKVFSAIGCHPHFANKWDEKIKSFVCETLSKPQIVAIGECGLDYSRKNNVPMDVQRCAFKSQLAIAFETGKPIVIHCRDMEVEVFEIMQEFLDPKHRIHLHCFTGGWAIGKKYLDYFENLCIGVTPLLTYNSREVKDLIENVPLERLLLETDAPYFVPQTIEFPLGIRASHPAFIFATVESVSRMRKIEINDLLDLNRANIKKIYGF